MVAVGQRMVGEEGQGAVPLAQPDSQVQQCLRLVRQALGSRIAELLQPDPLVLVVVDHDLVAAVGTALEVTGMRGVNPK